MFLTSFSQRQKKVLLFLLALVIALLVWQFIPYRPGGRVQEGDYLIYRTENSPLTLYDPFTNKHRPILEGWDVGGNFQLTPGRLAFSSDDNIYLLDYPFTGTPQKITSEQDIEAYPNSWSFNGYYLAYVTRSQDTTTLWIWDTQTQQTTSIYQVSSKNYSFQSGWDPTSQYFAYVTETETTNLWVWDTQKQQNYLIYHFDPNLYYDFRLEWSPNGQLAFAPSGGSKSPPNEIFIWDGQSVVNLSQNPAGNDSQPTWSSDGQLAFLSQIKEEHYQISIWDGVSKIGGMPDKNSFTHITAPNNEIYVDTSLRWNYQNSLFFIFPLASQIYQWNGKVVTPINNTPNAYYANWYKDEFWFISSWYLDNSLHIRTPDNQTLVTANRIFYEPIWSEYGLLAYCTNNEVQRVLKIGEVDNFLSELWAGATLNEAYARTSTKLLPVFHLFMWSGDTTTVKIVDGTIIIAYWSNGQHIYCFSGTNE